MWGKAAPLGLGRGFDRFNPTHVGKRVLYLRVMRINSVQPHACGEKARMFFSIVERNGSTPRMWGKGLIRVIIILPLPVQPHACGEKF